MIILDDAEVSGLFFLLDVSVFPKVSMYFFCNVKENIKEKRRKRWCAKCWGKQDEVRLATSACFSGQDQEWILELVSGPYFRRPIMLCTFSFIKDPTAGGQTLMPNDRVS